MKISQKDESYRVGDDDRYGIKYNLAVRTALGHSRKKNDEFTNILHDYGHVRESNPFYDPCYEELLNRLKVRVKELLKGHTDLILGFNSYLPKKLHFTLPLQLESETTEFHAACVDSSFTHEFTTRSIGYPSLSSLNSRYLSSHIPSPSNGSVSCLGSSSHQQHPLRYSESASSFSPFASANSLPDC